MHKPDRLMDLMKLYRHDGSVRFQIDSFPTNADGGFDKDAGTKLIKANRERLEELQRKLYAQDSWSLLLIFQGMDAAGKDSAIDSIFDGINPQGCEVTSFKRPSTLELDHDYLWRSTIRLPRRGMIGIFNRSYYEECLVARVHKDVLEKQRLPPQLVTSDIWRERFEDITAMERHLVRNGTVVLKFFLHLSKDEQRDRFLARLDEPSKNWKFEMGDVNERKHWDAYQDAYEDMIDHTSTRHAPWYVIPADRKWYARAMIGSVIVDALDRLKLTYPKSDPLLAKEFSAIRAALVSEGKPVTIEDAASAKSSGQPKAEAAQTPRAAGPAIGSDRQAKAEKAPPRASASAAAQSGTVPKPPAATPAKARLAAPQKAADVAKPKSPLVDTSGGDGKSAASPANKADT